MDPEDSGKQNVGIYRIEVKGKRKLALQPVPMHDIAQHLRKAEQVGDDLPIAITLGKSMHPRCLPFHRCWRRRGRD
ncbi:MAG: vanillate/4-hydroxybenzoate decarboxylase subunit, partial [Mycobacterium sp.]|nr:vanillate/4-hydroxybenzoate decarboxylase subunit [Mycobacterium sp.]